MEKIRRNRNKINVIVMYLYPIFNGVFNILGSDRLYHSKQANDLMDRAGVQICNSAFKGEV